MWDLRFLTAVITKSVIIWDTGPCRLSESYQLSEERTTSIIRIEGGGTYKDLPSLLLSFLEFVSLAAHVQFSPRTICKYVQVTKPDFSIIGPPND
jgi:hypothetical protein